MLLTDCWEHTDVVGKLGTGAVIFMDEYNGSSNHIYMLISS